MYAKTHAVHRTQEYDQWTATLNVAKNNSNFNEFK